MFVGKTRRYTCSSPAPGDLVRRCGDGGLHRLRHRGRLRVRLPRAHQRGVVWRGRLGAAAGDLLRRGPGERRGGRCGPQRCSRCRAAWRPRPAHLRPWCSARPGSEALAACALWKFGLRWVAPATSGRRGRSQVSAPHVHRPKISKFPAISRPPPHT